MRESDNKTPGLGRGVDLPMDEIPSGRDVTHVALVSGGMDSTVAAAVTDELVDLDLLAYLATGTGLATNEEYVREFGRALGVQPWTLATHEDYADAVHENGFPGPSRHSIMYRRLKERQIQKLNAVTGGPLVLWTGVRTSESERRLRNVDRVDTVERGWTWVAPIHDWTKGDCRDYMDASHLPENPLWDTLGRSGDCFCGCFGSPEEKLDLEAAGHADHAEWIRELEAEVDTGDKTETWAWGALDATEQRAEDARNDDRQMNLCSSCGVVPDGGEADD